jgi:hypothetical protein
MRKESNSGAEQKVELRESSLDYAILPTNEDSLFLHQNDYWIIRYHGRSALLKSTRGLQCLAVLLRDPGREFHVGELLARPMKASTPVLGVAANGRVTVRLDAGITVLDAQAKAEYKCRLHELRQDLHDAERFNDPVRRAEVQNEIHVLTNRLASAVGLGGRDRKTCSDAERARSAVTKSIKKAIKRIGAAIPSLGYHLAARIKTGYFCSYNPHPERRINWKFLVVASLVCVTLEVTM